ncbi:hypothetical protein CE154_005620 [Alicycliphilus denitrificans]|uniref:Uncharacterized protein n=1 Tax=Alicycliphilus denitrificans TaxID=179636 RepID=A0A3R7EGI4_9BURK|nr:hypothetical protein CE154_005620 [Alicycliphilus denitrificans]
MWVFMSLAGMCARRRSPFLLLRQKKGTKEKTTLLSVSLRFAAGNLRCSKAGVRCGTHCALARSVRTTAASQFTKHGCCDAHATPASALLGTARREPAIRAIAALGPAFAARSARAFQAERSDGPCGCSPLWLRLWRGGCGVSMGVEAPMLRGLTRRGCSNGAAQQRSEFCGAPRKRTATGLPRSAA